MKIAEIMEGLGAGKAYSVEEESDVWHLKLDGECVMVFWPEDKKSEVWEVTKDDLETTAWIEVEV